MRKALGKKPPEHECSAYCDKDDDGICYVKRDEDCAKAYHYRQALIEAADELETRLGNDGKCSWCDDMDRKQLCFYHNLIQEMKKSAGVK